MDYFKKKLINEIANFLDLCQEQVLNGKISVHDYCKLTQVKITFIEHIVGSCSKNELNCSLITRVQKIRSNNDRILSPSDRIIVE